MDDYNRAKAAGVRFAFVMDHDVARSVYKHDPDGNMVEIYADVEAIGVPCAMASSSRKSRMGSGRDLGAAHRKEVSGKPRSGRGRRGGVPSQEGHACRAGRGAISRACSIITSTSSGLKR